MLGVDAATVTTVIGGVAAAEDTFLVAVVDRDGEFAAVAAAGYSHCMAVLEGVLVAVNVKPVLAFPTVIYFVENGLRNKCTPVGGAAEGVEVGLVDDLHVLLSVEVAGLAVGIGPAYETVVGNGDLAFLTLLGGDEDYTVGGTCTVDGGGSGVLQYVDALDVVGVDAVQAVVCRTGHDTVDN